MIYAALVGFRTVLRLKNCWRIGHVKDLAEGGGWMEIGE